jgi:ribosomal protein L11 methyltransferase
MTRRILWKLSVVASPTEEEAVAELLAVRFGQTPSSYTDLKTGNTTVAIYLPAKPDWSTSARLALKQALRQATASRSQTVFPRVGLTKLRNEDWAESWKRHFKPLEIGGKLLIKPSWSRRRTKPGQVQVVLDPGMSFGTGQHPTTNFCLKEIAKARRAEKKQSFLDLGAGSGILAICAARLGYSPIDAVEIEPDSIEVAKANARLNSLSARIRFRCRDLTEELVLQGPFSLVCANLTSNLLLARSTAISVMVRPGGLLVLAGILKSEFAEVQRAYQVVGFNLLRGRTDREWRSGLFLRGDF